MDLRQLRYFLAVAQEEHFGRAANRLNIVQPALSMQIRALEEELGGLLFLRNSRHVALTEAGKLLLVEARRILDQAEYARRSVAKALRGESGTVRIGFAGNAIFSGKLIRDLRLFRETYPDVELVVREVPPQQQVAAILSGQMDIGYTPDHRKINTPEIAARKIGEWSMMVAFADTHPLAASAEITLDMLAGQPLILYEVHDNDAPLTRQLNTLINGHCQYVQRADSSLTVLAIAAAGLGVALIPEPLQQVTVPGLIYRKFTAPAGFVE
ncbi:LysR family transcriptional regulator [Shimwellia pseudoproteus]|uniref:LysR substrate-binding domain-containing protein n=1 Tax=Shimwellia pseudoproteus TaxID=570012 RepID=UPI0018EE17BA|nr:LysR substrate-binding domain-containing protein [Shimwellia pseudoproteus]MBJ3816415.1 LysR family transcriptional regulator [Shimwellia pseudoproteus]